MNDKETIELSALFVPIVPTGDPEADGLLQDASNDYQLRLAVLFNEIGIAARAVQMGPGMIGPIASELHYSATTVRRLSMLHDFPPELIDIDFKIGAYWAAINHAGAPVQFIRDVMLPERLTTPKAVKERLGVEVVRESRLAKIEAELDSLHQERQEIAAWLINAVDGFGSNLVEGVKMLLAKLREAEGND